MLNYPVAGRSTRQIQIIDNVLEEVYQQLTTSNTSIPIRHLPEPEGTPPEEATEEFLAAYEHAKLTDIEYLETLDRLSKTGADGENAITRLERELKDRVRNLLGLPPRPKRNEINRAEHARTLGINPSLELPARRESDSRISAHLQTLKYPDELESMLGKVSDQARLAQQESGLSTLFLTFGFLEWYDSEDSDKPHYAPLLLLPVRIEREKIKGRPVHSLRATEESAEGNISLKKKLEIDFERHLPDFDLDEEDNTSIEKYLERVKSSVEGLKRWQVHRWLVAGHFAFSRIAIFEDTDPANWPIDPTQHGLVGTILAGFERESADDSSSAHHPEDYEIDKPEFANIAPYLVQDADASQHSALIDVMKSKNLVIEGPPGTGKSQTIANIIANFMASGRTVLFLAEKQAALDAVKSRLDGADLGDFCLELHSDKASPKAVVESLKQRCELQSFPQYGDPVSDPVWDTSRRAIGEYLHALHSPEPDKATPFNLIWKALRGQSQYGRWLSEMRDVELPPTMFYQQMQLAQIRGQIELYSRAAHKYEGSFGSHVNSPWMKSPPDEVPQYDHPRLFETLRALRVACVNLQDFWIAATAKGISNEDDIEKLRIALGALNIVPNEDIVARITGFDMNHLARAVNLQLAHLDRENAFRTLATPHGFDGEKLNRAVQIVATSSQLVSSKNAAQLYQELDDKIALNEALIEDIEALKPARNILMISEKTPTRILGPIADACIIAGVLKEEHLTWVSKTVADETEFPKVSAECLELSREDIQIRAQIPRLPTIPPVASDVDAAVVGLRKTGLGKFFNKDQIESAKRFAETMGLQASDPATAETLERLSYHLRSIEAFNSNERNADIVGDSWRGMDTPFEELSRGLTLRGFIRSKIGAGEDAKRVGETMLRLSPSSLRQLGELSPIGKKYRQRASVEQNAVEDVSLDVALPRAKQEVADAQRLLNLDPARALAVAEAPLRDLAQASHRLAERDQALSAVKNAPLSEVVLSIIRTPDEAKGVNQAISWIEAVNGADIGEDLKARLTSGNLRECCRELREVAHAHEERTQTLRQKRDILISDFKIDIDISKLDSAISHCAELLGHSAELADFISLRKYRRELQTFGIEAFVNAAERLSVPPTEVSGVFDALIAGQRADRARRTNTTLGQAAGIDLEIRRTAFIDRDRMRKRTDRNAVKAKLLGRRPPEGERFGSQRTWTGMHLLRAEFTKQAKFVPVRGLLTRAGAAIAALKPCFMMSPLSLAKFVAPDTFEFDVLIIDEASQMRPEDALGAMLRARQIVVVGDPKQLPPSSFFDRANIDNSSDDEMVDEIDEESILERCEKAFGQVRRLKWHYRSRCESLIRFSNEQFYDGKLITFPTAKPGAFSVDLVRVDGAYQARRNVAEAERIAEEAVSFMRRFANLDSERIPTLGIVAVNTDQRDLILELLHRMGTGDELVEQYRSKAESRGEPLFVKNLENVQGDERDFIFISLTYGKEPNATALKQRFGPITGKQGHRRLNVLFTRARVRIALFCSFGSADVKLSETSSRGVHVLKQYLEYAEVRGRAPVEGIGTEADSDFEVEVAQRLRQRGYRVDIQVGVSGYRIDIGVRHPDHPEHFLVGVECDGAAYHSSKSARDRDRLREEVLRGLGWEILRVWSTDWFNDADSETDKLVRSLEALRAQPFKNFNGYDIQFESPITPVATETPEVDAFEQPASTDVILFPSAQESLEPIIIDAAPHDPLGGDGPLTEIEASEALRAFRDAVIKQEITDWEPHRSLLRDGMIETFVRQRVVDSTEWYTKIPPYQRTGTNAAEKTRYLDRVCQFIERIS